MTDPETNGTDSNTPDPSDLRAFETNGTDAKETGPDATLLVRERSTPEGLLVSVCDEPLLGDSLSTADGEVSIEVSEEFYGGDPRDRDAAAATLARAQVANLVGDHAVSLAVEVGLVDPVNVLDLDGTPHAQFMRL